MKATKSPAAVAAHTSGPWHTQGTGQVFDAYGNEVAECKRYGAGIIPAGYVAPWHSCDANARLISAAPDLLAALKEIVADHESCIADDQPGFLTASQLGNARAAIAKAEDRAL